MRLPLSTDISSRDGSSTKNARMYNVLSEKKPTGQVISAVRPGLTQVALAPGVNVGGDGIYCWNGTFIAIFNDILYNYSSGNLIPISDPYFSLVVALLHFDGANGATTFTDQKGHTFTAFGTSALSTSTPKYGTAALSTGDNSSSIEAPTSPDWNMGSGDFTIEGWIRVSDISTGLAYLVAIFGASGAYHVAVYRSANRIGFLVADATGSGYINTVNSETGAVLSNNVWTHIAAVRYGTNFNVYINGVKNATMGYSSSITPFFTAGSTLKVGYRTGNFDDFRITKGLARYTVNFTPPAYPFPNT